MKGHLKCKFEHVWLKSCRKHAFKNREIPIQMSLYGKCVPPQSTIQSVIVTNF